MRLGNTSSFFSNIPNASLEGALITGLVTPSVWIDFGGQPVRRTGLLMNCGNADGTATFRLAVYGVGHEELGYVDVAQERPEDAVFLGFESPEGIALARVQRIAAAHFAYSNILDDVRFEAVPEPCTSVLLNTVGFGIFILLLRRRRREG